MIYNIRHYTTDLLLEKKQPVEVIKGRPASAEKKYIFKAFTVRQLMLYHIHLGGDVRDIKGTSY